MVVESKVIELIEIIIPAQIIFKSSACPRSLHLTKTKGVHCLRSRPVYPGRGALFILFHHSLRDWSLITGRGGLKNGKIAGPKLFAPPPSRQGKTFRAPPFKEWKLYAPPPPYNMAKTSSYRVKSTPKLFVPPPSEWLKLFLPPLFVGVTLHVPPPSRFVAPPSP